MHIQKGDGDCRCHAVTMVDVDVALRQSEEGQSFSFFGITSIHHYCLQCSLSISAVHNRLIW